MRTRVIDGIEVEIGSGNVFADLGLPDAEKLKIKSGLLIEISKAIRRLELTQAAAAERMGIPQPKVSALLRGDLTNMSERKLMDCLKSAWLRHRNHGEGYRRPHRASDAGGALI